MAALRVFNWLAALLWVPLLVGVPVLTWHSGTARDIRVEVVAAPYRDAPALLYRWTGDVYRACPIRLHRQIIDAAGYVHDLVPAVFDAPNAPPGPLSFVITVETPVSLPVGQAVYRVTERPACTWLQRLWSPHITYPPLKFTVTQ